MITSLILFIVSFPKSSLSHPLDSQVYFIVVILITVFTSLTVVNMWGEMKDFVAMN